MTQKKGFAVMDPDTQRQIARLGGRIAHSLGNAHEFTSGEAKLAGRKGGLISSRNRRLQKVEFHQVKKQER